MALTKIVQATCRSLWLGTEGSASVPVPSPPTKKVLQPWHMLPGPPASTRHYRLCLGCSDSPGTGSPDYWSVQVTRPFYGITWVLHISSWNSSRNPLLAVLWLSLLVYLSPLQSSSCSALWAWRDGLCQTHTLSQSWCDHPASASISSLPPAHHVLVNTRYLSGSHSSGSFSPLDIGWPLSAWLWLAK